MTTQRRQTHAARARRLAAASAPAILCFGLGRLGATHSTGILLVLAEPLLLGLLLYGAAALAMHRQWAASLGTLLAIGTGAIALHLPSSRPVVPGVANEWTTELRGCAVLPEAPKAPIRVVNWTVDPSLPIGPTLAQLTTHRPDIVVLLGTDDPAIADQLSEVMSGEVQRHSEGQGAIVAVRGSFKSCGDETQKWTVELPASEQAQAHAWLSFTHIEHMGTIPLMVVAADRPQGISDLPAWTDRLQHSSEILASIAHSIGPRRMLIAGDFQAPSSAQPLSRPLLGAGLQAVNTPPSWPTRLGPFPFLAQHAVDQVWAGKSWHAQRARVLPAGEQTRAPIIVDLSPVETPAG